MELREINQKKNVFVDQQIHTCTEEECGVFSFSPEYFRKCFADFEFPRQLSRSLPVDNALTHFLNRKTAINANEHETTLFDALQYAYLHTCLSNEDTFIDGRLFLEYVHLFLSSEVVILKNMDDILMYAFILVNVDRLQYENSLYGKIMKWYPRIADLTSNLTRRDTGRSTGYLNDYLSLTIGKDTFLRHLRDCSHIVAYHIYKDRRDAQYSDDDIKQFARSVTARCHILDELSDLLNQK